MKNDLEKWMFLFKRVEKDYLLLKNAFSASPESQVVGTMYDLFLAYTEVLSKNLGDKDCLLDWYIWENDCGKKEFLAKASNWEKSRKIKNLKDLEDLIIGCKRV